MNCNNNGNCCMNLRGCNKRTDKKLDTYDWLCDIPEVENITDYVEVIFKNTRKGYFKNTNKLKLEKGDVIAVESSPGHDIGTISLTGPLVLLQMKKNSINLAKADIKRIYRKARASDIEKYEEAKAREHETMLQARKIAEGLKLNMKIGDVEYQGDGNKAIFYYIADERVDFRQLIKVLADTFKVRIEMKQIGARQEAGRIGGIGPCGRPLCCSQWMSNFVSVATSAARYQEISLNPQKLAGQCAKLKCCMNFEVDSYVEAQKGIPSKDVPLETKDATFYHFKTDVFKKIMQYSSAPNMAANIISLPVERVREIMKLNKAGIKVDSLDDYTGKEVPEKQTDYENVVGQDSLTRFDKRKKNKPKNKQRNENQPQNAKQGSEQKQGNNNQRSQGEKKVPEKPAVENKNQGNPPINQQSQEVKEAADQHKNRENANANNPNRKNNRKKKARPIKPNSNNEKNEA